MNDKPELCIVEAWRNPTKSEIKFGHGCIIRTFAVVPKIPSLRPKRMKIGGTWWNIPR